MNLGWIIGSPLGTKLRSSLSYLVLYSINLCLTAATILYCVFFLKESIYLVSEERRIAMMHEKENADIKCDKGKKNTSAAVKFLLVLEKTKIFEPTLVE